MKNITSNNRASFCLRLLAGALAAISLLVLPAGAQTSATLYTDGTSFGIGTTAPSGATLEIVKNAGQPLLKVSSTGGGR